MSHVTFPQHNNHPPSPTASSSVSQHHTRKASFYPSSFDPDASQSAFQINPDSYHPPRTPRPSIIGNENTYLSQPYNGVPEQSQIANYYQEETHREEPLDHADSDKPSKLRRREVWKDILASTAGRDKALKLVQYSMKLYVLLHKTVAGDMRRRVPRVPGALELELMRRVSSGMAGLSLTRKCLLLFNWLTPLNAITHPEAIPFAATSAPKPTQKPILYQFLQAPPPVLLDLVNCVAEDISTSAKLGLLKGKLAERAGRMADWTWFAGTLVALVELSMERTLVRNMTSEVQSRLYAENVEFTNKLTNPAGRETDEKELKKLQAQLYWIRVSRMKLLMDLIFVTYDCFRIKRGSEAIKTITGLASACLSTAKLYDKHRSVLAKALLS